MSIPKSITMGACIGRYATLDSPIKNGAGQCIDEGSRVKIISYGRALDIVTEKCSYCGQYSYIGNVKKEKLTLCEDEPQKETSKSSISEAEKCRHNKLIQLIRENPDLPVIPMVDAEICCGDDYGRWIGSFGDARIDEYLTPVREDEPVLYKSDNDILDALESYLDYDEFEKLHENEEECRKIYESLPWKKVIIVNIDMPE